MQVNLDSQLSMDALRVICETFQVESGDIKDITALKKGMTNCSFLFRCKGKRYIIRISGKGTERLINRYQEAQVYKMLGKENICDPVIYINPENGYKITEFLENSRVCNPFDESDVKQSVHFLRKFHNKKIVVDHEFNIFGQIDFYEMLWGGADSVYKDYKITRENIYSLRPYIEKYAADKVLTHIDAVPDNFLFIKNKEGDEEIRLIDWEYAGMQDPHVDIAMFCIYSLYDRKQVEHLIDLYFIEGCSREIRTKIYCYIAVCGLLWSNWCEYKRIQGIHFGEYALRQYEYAKEYYEIVRMELQEMRND